MSNLDISEIRLRARISASRTDISALCDEVERLMTDLTVSRNIQAAEKKILVGEIAKNKRLRRNIKKLRTALRACLEDGPMLGISLSQVGYDALKATKE